MIDPAIGAVLAGAFALLFVSAALHKLRSLQRFAEVFRAYRLLPEAVARLREQLGKTGTIRARS